MTQDNRTQLTTPSEREITLTRLFDAPRALVWKAWTRPDLVERWMIGRPGHILQVCEMDFKVGGALRYVWIIEEDREMGLKGVFRDIKAPERIVHTEIFDDWPDNETLVTTLFTEDDTRTMVAMTIRYESEETRDIVLKSPMQEGVAHTYRNLDRLLTEIGQTNRRAASNP